MMGLGGCTPRGNAFVMINRVARAVISVVLGLGSTGAGTDAFAKDKDNVPYISIGLAAYDFMKKRDRQPEYRLEYRGQKLLGPLKPYVGVAGTLCPGEWINSCVGTSWTGSFFAGGGALIDLKVSDNVFLSPSLGLAWYSGGTTDLDLGSPLIGRAQMELGFRFDDNSRFSVALSHYDNMGTGDTNPGTQSLTAYISIPLD